MLRRSCAGRAEQRRSGVGQREWRDPLLQCFPSVFPFQMHAALEKPPKKAKVTEASMKAGAIA